MFFLSESLPTTKQTRKPAELNGGQGDKVHNAHWSSLWRKNAARSRFTINLHSGWRRRLWTRGTDPRPTKAQVELNTNTIQTVTRDFKDAAWLRHSSPVPLVFVPQCLGSRMKDAGVNLCLWRVNGGGRTTAETSTSVNPADAALLFTYEAFL